MDKISALEAFIDFCQSRINAKNGLYAEYADCIPNTDIASYLCDRTMADIRFWNKVQMPFFGRLNKAYEESAKFHAPSKHFEFPPSGYSEDTGRESIYISGFNGEKIRGTL